MNVPASTWWIVLIAVGAAVVAISNIQYNRARDAENKKAKAVQVRQLLKKELEHNAQLIHQMRDSLKHHSAPVEAFDTTAWQTISEADLLLGLPNDDLANLLQAYRLLNRANDLHAKIME